jgi:bacillithiol biosynthesis cysteine-adding enzyme BshC
VRTSARFISYQTTGLFSSLVTDYLKGNGDLEQFYSYPTTREGIAAAIGARKNFPTDRARVQQIFQSAYEHADPSEKQQENIALLAHENTFTVCTAHQPNIFSGYLYFIYKTAHAVVLASSLSKEYPEYKFVPVFYIGSEDNDIDELSTFRLNGKRYQWDTAQKGAVGRMKVDKQLIDLIGMIESELAHFPHASELINILRKAYHKGNDIAQGTFILLNELFKQAGLLVLQPDAAILKEKMKDVFRDDLLHNTAYRIVSDTNTRLSANYKLQVNPREINLFYLRDDVRNRIDKLGNSYIVDDTSIRFTEEQILQELDQHPERFSPNVILRGLFQETILPNILFVGGGSEVAYWMQLKDLFQHYKVPFPLLVLRNSFLIMDQRQSSRMTELGLTDEDLFKDETKLANALVQQWSGKEISLTLQISESQKLFSSIKQQAGDVDNTLLQHVQALEAIHLKKIHSLEKKMLKAEREKQQVHLNRIWRVMDELFPNKNLQERIENFMPYYAKYGHDFINMIMEHSRSLEQYFGMIVVEE